MLSETIQVREDAGESYHFLILIPQILITKLFAFLLEKTYDYFSLLIKFYRSMKRKHAFCHDW